MTASGIADALHPVLHELFPDQLPGEEVTLPRKSIVRLPDLQVRAAAQGFGPLSLRTATVEQYKQLIQEALDRPNRDPDSVPLGRLVVIRISGGEKAGQLVMADGFHRDEAWAELQRDVRHVRVFAGSLGDAYVVAARINANRGLQYSVADRGKVAEKYVLGLWLQIKERLDAGDDPDNHRNILPDDGDIAADIGVDRSTVSRAWTNLSATYDLPPVRLVRRGDQVYVQKRRAVEAPPPAPTDADYLDRTDPSAYAALPDAYSTRANRAPTMQPSRNRGAERPDLRREARPPAADPYPYQAEQYADDYPASLHRRHDYGADAGGFYGNGNGHAPEDEPETERVDPEVETASGVIDWSYTRAGDGRTVTGRTRIDELHLLPSPVRRRLLANLGVEV